jgi:hypothetical protein
MRQEPAVAFVRATNTPAYPKLVQHSSNKRKARCLDTSRSIGGEKDKVVGAATSPPGGAPRGFGGAESPGRPT